MADATSGLRAVEKRDIQQLKKKAKTGFGPTESEVGKMVESQQQQMGARIGQVGQQLMRTPSAMSAKPMQAPMQMQNVATAQRMAQGIAAEQAGVARKTDELRQAMATKEKERLRTAVTGAAKRRAEARQSVLDNAYTMAELGLRGGAEISKRAQARRAAQDEQALKSDLQARLDNPDTSEEERIAILQALGQQQG